jgi:DNA-binding beta-propeller fold protein YncE
LVANGQIYVSDQTASKIFQLPLDGGVRAAAQASTFSALAYPDQLCAGPDGSLFTGQFQAAVGSSEPPAVRQIMRDATVKLFASAPDMNRPSGVAYDPAKRRLFVANGGPKGEHFIRVFSVP